MKQDYETFKKEAQWPKFTTLKISRPRQALMYIGYIATLGILALLSQWLEKIQLWIYDVSYEGDYVLIEEADNSFEILHIDQKIITDSCLNFSGQDNQRIIEVSGIIDF
jgi:P5-type ATPase cation transporter